MLSASMHPFCPVCGSEKLFSMLCPVKLVSAAPVYGLAECPDCLTRFISPTPEPEEIKRFYTPQYYGGDWYKQEEKGRVFGHKMLRRGFGEKILDVGCSLGFFIYGLSRVSGWEVYGTEISPEAAAFARNHLGLDVHCGELAEAKYEDQFFDYVRVNNVLEHVSDPLRFLKECRRILRPEGKLYLSVPNGLADSAGLLKYFHGKQQTPRSKDGHLFFFSRAALFGLFKASNFEIIDAHTYGIRRGLRAFGWYPPKPGWHEPYMSREEEIKAPEEKPEEETDSSEGEIVLPPRPRRLPGYADWRFRMFRLKRLPGLLKFGLDFEILLQAR